MSTLLIPRTQAQLDAVRDQGYKQVTEYAMGAACNLCGGRIYVEVNHLKDLISKINKQFGLSNEQISSYSVAHKQVINGIIKRAGLVLIGNEITRNLIARVLKKDMGISIFKHTLKIFFRGFIANADSGMGIRAMEYVGNSHVDDCYRVCRRFLELTEAAAGDHATS